MQPLAENAEIRVRADYDFASSLCHVAHRVMGRMEPDLAELGLFLDRSPLDLTGITGWPRGAVAEPSRRATIHPLAAELGGCRS